MARGGLDFQKIGWVTATFKAGDELKGIVDDAKGYQTDGRKAALDLAVYLSDDQEVDVPSSGTEPIFGRVEQYESDDHVTVQVGGFCEIPMTETSGDRPEVGGYAVVNDDGEAEAAEATEYTIEYKDHGESNQTKTIEVPKITRAFVVSIDTEDNTCIVFLS